MMVFKVAAFKLYLIVWVMGPNGEWVHGDEVDGWAKREQVSMEVCENHKEKLEGHYGPKLHVECRYQ